MTEAELHTKLKWAVAKMNEAAKMLAEAQLALGECRHKESSSLQKIRTRINTIARSVKT